MDIQYIAAWATIILFVFPGLKKAYKALNPRIIEFFAKKRIEIDQKIEELQKDQENRKDER